MASWSWRPCHIYLLTISLLDSPFWAFAQNKTLGIHISRAEQNEPQNTMDLLIPANSKGQVVNI